MLWGVLFSRCASQTPPVTKIPNTQSHVPWPMVHENRSTLTIQSCVLPHPAHCSIYSSLLQLPCSAVSQT
ncbi:unnamed protein product [Pleuronectes platessa]|uniref:Uncharacterized protein n=1 Tax=Pleuronectes platessa TaxID=8262 RepID=A0A9N7TMC8_PLEPL|nr:unnamed protein product [Pleuronectes platessa]